MVSNRAWKRFSQLKGSTVLLLALYALPFIVTLSPYKAIAWGHLADVANANTAAPYLVTRVMASNEIRFCVEIDPIVRNHFSESRLRKEEEAFLRMWLNPAAKSHLIKNVEIKAQPCELQTHDLKLYFGPHVSYPDLRIYQAIHTDSRRSWSQIDVNTDWAWADLKFQDLSDVLKLQNSELPDVLKLWASSSPQTDKVFLDSKGLGDRINFFRWSTRALLHETGHSFGLCDTIYGSRSHCDPAFLTEQASGSVMSTNDFVNLTDDDQKGIIELFRRFASRPLSKESK